MSPPPSPVQVAIERQGDQLVVQWSDARSDGSCRFDHLPDTVPEWLGSADELLGGADRRQEERVLAAIAAWADGEGLTVGIWHDGGDVELLG